jgi:hypothetical protein
MLKKRLYKASFASFGLTIPPCRGLENVIKHEFADYGGKINKKGKGKFSWL